MNETVAADASAAQDAAEALIALGWPVTPYGPDMDGWQIGDLILTNADLTGLAARQGVRAACHWHYYQ